MRAIIPFMMAQSSRSSRLPKASPLGAIMSTYEFVEYMQSDGSPWVVSTFWMLHAECEAAVIMGKQVSTQTVCILHLLKQFLIILP